MASLVEITPMDRALRQLEGSKPLHIDWSGYSPDPKPGHRDFDRKASYDYGTIDQEHPLTIRNTELLKNPAGALHRPPLRVR